MWTGADVRDLRVRLGWSQEQLAQYLRVAQRTVSQWETGKSKPLRAHHEKFDRLKGQV